MKARRVAHGIGQPAVRKGYACCMSVPRVVIIGAGFGGLECAKKLAGRAVQVRIIDRNNYHLFTPLLYQVASSLLNPGDIARPVRAIFRGSGNVRFTQAEVVGVDLERQVVKTTDLPDIPYDFLVVAAGSTTNFFGMSAVAERALGLKDLSEALELRNHILRCLEAAATKAPDEAGPWLTFAIVGGGPTGVEYAGALSELVRILLPGEYPELAHQKIRILLLEGMDELLPPFPSGLGAKARLELQQKGVEVRTGVRVTSADDEGVQLSNGEFVATRTLIWSAGVRPADLATALDVGVSRSGRIEVDRFMRIRGQDGAFAIGDIASVPRGEKEIPMLSAPAMQEGRVVAENILRTVQGKPLRAFRYRDRGSMATVGKGVAVASIGPIQMAGFPGWIAWLAVHLYYIIGFRNRFVVLSGWAWNYLRSDRPVRIITRARGR